MKVSRNKSSNRKYVRKKKFVTLEEQLDQMNYSDFLKAQFKQIKNYEFTSDVLDRYILTHKDTEDFDLYCCIKANKNLKQCYQKVLKNCQKNGHYRMAYDKIVSIYLSKRFNQKVLKPMCEEALKVQKPKKSKIRKTKKSQKSV